MTEYEAKIKADHGDSVIYEDRGIIDMACVDVDVQPCGAVDHTLIPHCKEPGVYRIFGQYKSKSKGSRFQKFDQHLCATHLAAWAKLHGTTVQAMGL